MSARLSALAGRERAGSGAAGLLRLDCGAFAGALQRETPGTAGDGTDPILLVRLRHSGGSEPATGPRAKKFLDRSGEVFSFEIPMAELCFERKGRGIPSPNLSKSAFVARDSLLQLLVKSLQHTSSRTQLASRVRSPEKSRPRATCAPQIHWLDQTRIRISHRF